MPLSTATVTFDISDLVGTDYDRRRGIRGWVDTNIPTDTVVDTDGNKVRLGSGKVVFNDDGTGSFTVWVPGTGSNPASWQTSFHVEYVDSGDHKKGRQTRDFGPFTITGNTDLADLIQEQEVPPTYVGTLISELETLRDETEAARDEAVDISGISTTDAAVASRITTPGTATATALSATFAPVRDVGSLAPLINTAFDSASTLRAIVNAARDEARSSGMGKRNAVTVPPGKYKIGTTVVVPPYIKLVLDGVIFEWIGAAGGTCLHVTPLSDDPTTLYSGLTKQQWTNSPIIDGGHGGFVIRNANGLGQVGIGLEVGARSDLGSSRPMARYTMRHIAVEGFAVGKKMNTYHHYVGDFYNLHLESNGTAAVQVGDIGVDQVNSGENFAYHHCIFAGATVGYDINIFGWDVNFMSCSLDFLAVAYRVAKGYGRAYFAGGHIENINDNKTAAVGGIVVSNASTSDPNNVAHVYFDGTTILAHSRPMFRGTNVKIDGAAYFRGYDGDANTTYPNSIMADSTVSIGGLRNLQETNHRIISAEHNRLEDPTFNSETLGAVAGNLSKWTIAKGGGATVAVVSTTPIAGGQALELTLPVNSYVDLTAIFPVIPQVKGADRYANLVLRTDRTGINASAGGRYIGASGNEVGVIANVDIFGINALAANTWHIPNFSLRLPTTYAARAESVRPRFIISNPSGASGTAVVTVPMLYFGE